MEQTFRMCIHIVVSDMDESIVINNGREIIAAIYDADDTVESVVSNTLNKLFPETAVPYQYIVSDFVGHDNKTPQPYIHLWFLATPLEHANPRDGQWRLWSECSLALPAKMITILNNYKTAAVAGTKTVCAVAAA